MSVKPKKRGRPKRSEDQLSSDAILHCAKTLLKNEGKVPSVRKISGELKVDPMAIYYYFANKAALLEAVSVSLMESIYRPTGSDTWQEELTLLCMSYLILLKEHPGLLDTMLSMSTQGPAQVFIERLQTILAPLNLTDETLKNAIDLLADYLHGFALSMTCNTSSETLTIDQAKGPLSLYTKGLEAEISPT